MLFSRRAPVALFLAMSVVVVGCVGGAGGEPSATTQASMTPRLVDRPEWGSLFDDAGVTGTFVLREVGSDQTWVFDVDRATRRRLPASTFKVLNSMIILETGTVAGVDTVVPWDDTVREIPEWNRDHSLRSGIEVSAVWLFQALARDVGEREMAGWVERADYGNADIGGGIDEFWLRGELRISPVEQLDFLERMVEGELPFSSAVVDAVREILVREQGDDWSWSHKTGTALAAEPTLGWLVGTTHNRGREWVFAMNLDLSIGGLDGEQIDPQLRQRIAREVLVAEGALPSG